MKTAMTSSESSHGKAQSIEKDVEAARDNNDSTNDDGVDEITEQAVPTRSRRSLSLRKTHSSTRRENIVVEIFPESDLEKGIIGWEGQDDPRNPKCVILLVSRLILLRGVSAWLTSSQKLSRVSKMVVAWLC